MSQGITHFAVGATATVLLLTLAVPAVRYPRTWTLLGGSWALVPDASKLHPVPETLAFHDSAWANLFWAHRALDRFDAGDSTVWASAAVAVLLGATMVAERRAYKLPAAIQSSLEDHSLLDRE